MTRPIKFRAWDIKAARWQNPKDDGVAEIVIAADGKKYWLTGLFRPIPDGEFIVEQFTGLHDRNGKEIYEGDIVKSPGFLPTPVEWRGTGFNISSSYQDDGGGDCAPETVYMCYEVIGNIHTTPELLKERP